MNIPDNYHVLFLQGGATKQFAAIPMNLMLTGTADYINGKSIEASDLYPIKEFIQHLKFQKLLDRYDDLYSMDMFGESIEGHKYRTPYQVVKMINPNSKEDMELLSKLPWVTGKFDDEDE